MKGATLGLLCFLAAVAIVYLVLAGVTFERDKTFQESVLAAQAATTAFQEEAETHGYWQLDESVCGAGHSVCQKGLAFVDADGDIAGCSVINEPVGTACASVCHVDNSSTTCNARQECLDAGDQTTCLGYCHIDEPFGDFTYEYDSPECVSKLVFRPFNEWNVPGTSTLDYTQWLYYSDYPAECNPYLGCTWYSMRLLVDYISSRPADIQTTGLAAVDCLSLLDMENVSSVDCVQATAIAIDSNASTLVWKEALGAVVLWPFGEDPILQTEMCIYSYKCFTTNQTFFEDPAFVYNPGKKRTTTEQKKDQAWSLQEHAFNVFKRWATFAPPHPQLVPYLEAQAQKKRALLLPVE